MAESRNTVASLGRLRMSSGAFSKDVSDESNTLQPSCPDHPYSRSSIHCELEWTIVSDRPRAFLSGFVQLFSSPVTSKLREVAVTGCSDVDPENGVSDIDVSANRPLRCMKISTFRKARRTSASAPMKAKVSDVIFVDALTWHARCVFRQPAALNRNVVPEIDVANLTKREKGSSHDEPLKRKC